MLFSQAAIFVLSAAPAGTRIIPANFGMGPVPLRLGQRELCNEWPGVVEKALISRAKIIKPGFAIRGLEDAIFRATATAHIQNLAC